jgi:diguanylate cyclase (GGDEF)-like protein
MRLRPSATEATRVLSDVVRVVRGGYEAEAAFVIARPLDGGPPELVGAAGLDDATAAALLHAPPVSDLLAGAGTGSRTANGVPGLSVLALAPFAAPTGGRAVVGVARRADRPFDDAELALLDAIAASVGHALERERRAAQQAALASAASAIHASLDLDQVLAAICAEAVRAFGADVAIVSVRDDRDGYAAIAAHGVPESFVGMSRERDKGLSGRVMATGEPLVSDAYDDEGHAALRGVRRAVAAPLRRSHGVDGALEIGFRRNRPVGAADAELLAGFADLAAVACRNADALAAAQRAASRDSLTGCLNHGALQSRLHEEISRADRGGGPVTLALVDLDDFKSVNERFGHLAGDAALRGVGEQLRGSVRLHDQVGRLGGDEFALVLGATAEASRRIVDRALRSLRGVPLPAGEELRATAGVAEWRAGVQATGLIDEADRALRGAKRGHRKVAVARAGEGMRIGEGSPAQRRRLATAGALGAKLRRLRDVQAIATVVAEDLHDVLGFPSCRVAGLRGGRLEVMAGAGGVAPSTQAPDEAAIGRCVRERRPVLVADASVDGGTRSELAVPLYVGGEVWGAIDLRSAGEAGFDSDDAQVVQTVADHAGAALSETARVLEQR